MIDKRFDNLIEVQNLIRAVRSTLRSKIYALVSYHQSMTPSQLAEELGVSKASISAALKIMRDAGVLDYSKEKTEHYYFVTEWFLDVWSKIAKVLDEDISCDEQVF